RSAVRAAACCPPAAGVWQPGRRARHCPPPALGAPGRAEGPATARHLAGAPARTRRTRRADLGLGGGRGGELVAALSAAARLRRAVDNQAADLTRVARMGPILAAPVQRILGGIPTHAVPDLWQPA